MASLVRLSKCLVKVEGTLIALLPDDPDDPKNNDVIVLVKLAKAVFDDHPYVVWHFNDTAGLYWGRYDLTLSGGLQVMESYGLEL
jgi:hypothetical protein